MAGINSSLRNKLKVSLIPGMQGSAFDQRTNNKISIDAGMGEEPEKVRPGIIARRRRERSQAHKLSG